MLQKQIFGVAAQDGLVARASAILGTEVRDIGFVPLNGGVRTDECSLLYFNMITLRRTIQSFL
jgi:hypothetical protein